MSLADSWAGISALLLENNSPLYLLGEVGRDTTLTGQDRAGVESERRMLGLVLVFFGSVETRDFAN